MITKTSSGSLKELRCKSETSCARKLPRCDGSLNETVGIAAQLMRASNISALVVKDVVDRATPRWHVYRRDIVRAIAEHGAAGVNLKISQLIQCSNWFPCVSTDTLEHVRHLMNKNHIRHLPVPRTIA